MIIYGDAKDNTRAVCATRYFYNYNLTCYRLRAKLVVQFLETTIMVLLEAQFVKKDSGEN